MSTKWKRWIAAIMTAAMVTALFPSTAMAEGGEPEPEYGVVETELPQETEEPTGTPQESETPEESETPQETEAPVETPELPEETEAPVETPELPEETEAPEETGEPEKEPVVITFVLGGGEQVEVALEEGASLAEEQIPTANGAGTLVCRWLDDEKQVVSPLEEENGENATYTAWYAPALMTEHTAYITGLGGGKFGPDQKLTRAEAVTMLYGLLADKSMGEFPCDFSDVASDKWYYKQITTLASLNLIAGDGGEFGPNEPVTRAEFAEMISRLIPVSHAKLSFPDVAEDSEYYTAVAACQEQGWICGYEDGTFRPNNTLTRAEAVVIYNNIMNRALDEEILASHKDQMRWFSDVSTGSWYYKAIMESSMDHTASYDENGVEHWTSAVYTTTVTYVMGSDTKTEKVYPGNQPVSVPSKTSSGTVISRWVDSDTGSFAVPSATVAVAGHNKTYTAWCSPSLTTNHSVYVAGYEDATFRPNNKLTWGEAVVMVYALLSDKSKGSYPCSFTDVASGEWYYGAVTTLASKKLIDCDGGQFYPYSAITRADFAELVARLTTLDTSGKGFADVDASNPHYAAIMTCAKRGWVCGYEDGTFRPDDSLTRAEAVVILNNIQGRTGDAASEKLMDSRYTFSDVAVGDWFFTQVMEAATAHTWNISNSKETWTSYYHDKTSSTDWESSASVVQDAKILTTGISSAYEGDYTQKYNVDYSTKTKENYINGKGYSSSTHYLIWVSRATQKVNVFYSSTGNAGTWTLYKEFTCGTGAKGSETPVGVTYITYRQKDGWTTSSYTVAPVVRFYPNSGYAFHSRLYYPGSSKLKSPQIGYPMSHGCVRMLTPDVTWIYNEVPNKTCVVVY